MATIVNDRDVILQAASPRTITATLPGFTVADATAALADLVNIASDAVLSKNEKPGTVADYQTILAKQTGIDIEAGVFGATTTGTYNTAITALTTYLTGLTPAYNDYTTDTTIVGATLISKFNDVYVAEQVLHNEIATIASSGVLIGASNIHTAMVGSNQINTPITSYSTSNVVLAENNLGVTFIEDLSITSTGGIIFITACLSGGNNLTYLASFNILLYRDCLHSGSYMSYPLAGIALNNSSGYYDGTNNTTVTFMITDQPPAGTHTYNLAGSAGGGQAHGATVFNIFLSVVEVKR